MVQNVMALGVDVGGTSVKAAVVDQTGYTRRETVTTFDAGSDGSSEEILGRFERHLKPLAEHPIAGVGLGFPGPFDYDRGISRIRGLGKYDSLYGIDVGEELRRRLGLAPELPVRFINDAHAFAMGESGFGAARGFARTLVITLGTGCGSTFLVDGKVVTEGEGVPESGWIYDIPFDGTIIDDRLSKRGILRLRDEVMGASAAGYADVADLARAAYEGNMRAERVFRLFGWTAARALGPILARFNAEALVIGGGIARSFSLFAPDLVKELERQGVRARVVQAQDIDLSAVRGAASAALDLG